MFNTTKTISRLAALTMVAGVVGLGAGPVSATAPTEGSFTVKFTDVNPCTEELTDITIHIEFHEHFHKNNAQGRALRTGTTSDGYVMEHGRESITENKNVFRQAFRDTWRNPDGSAFRVNGVFVAKESGVVVDRFSISCLGN